MEETDEVSWFFLRRHAEEDFRNDGLALLEKSSSNKKIPHSLFSVKDSLYLIGRSKRSFRITSMKIGLPKSKGTHPMTEPSRKEVHHFMNGPIISFDVSKGSSHMQGFYDHGRPAGRPIVISHDTEGFAKINQLVEKIREETGSQPLAVYEHTGVYSHTLERYLDSAGIRRYEISPLESAKVRKSMIRPTKNDSLDYKTIAEVYYLRGIREVRNDSEAFVTLREMSRSYRYLLEVKIVEKGRYHRCLDDVWPCFDKVIEPDSPR